jgi:hypothetical protein
MTAAHVLAETAQLAGGAPNSDAGTRLWARGRQLTPQGTKAILACDLGNQKSGLRFQPLGPGVGDYTLTRAEPGSKDQWQ